MLGRNPVSVRNGACKPFARELVSGTVRELILGKDLWITPWGKSTDRELCTLRIFRNQCWVCAEYTDQIILSFESQYGR